MWDLWNSGEVDWAFGRIQPDEVLYYYDGPAIFSSKIGLANFLFFKSDEHDDGDYFIASRLFDAKASALKAGRLSVRGALSSDEILLLKTDLSLHVVKYEIKTEAEVGYLLPKSGVPMIGSYPTAADSLAQVNSLFAFKFFGDELSENSVPLSTFKGLVDRVHNVVRDALTPLSLSGGRDKSFLDFAVRPLQFASLLIAIDKPEVDAARLAAQRRTKSLDPSDVVEAAYERGREFALKIERTVELASRGNLPSGFGSENFEFLHQIIDILPSSDGDISRLQFSSNNGDSEVFVEVESAAGDRIRDSFAATAGQDAYIVGTVDGLIGSSKTIRLRTMSGREVTCQLKWGQFDELVASQRLRYGVNIGVRGLYVGRERRDWMKVEGEIVFL